MKNLVCALFIVLGSFCKGQTVKTANDTRQQNEAVAVDEKSFIVLGGEKQYVEMTGSSSKNPVLLFLHGGPGWPQTPHLRYFNAALTKSMTLVAWEQSGCGKSLLNNPEPRSLSLDQIIRDAHQLTQILKKKFKKDKIYLAGFSWGSVVGVHLIEKYPEDFSAYIGISQVINLKQGIKLSRAWIAARAKENNDLETLKVLEQIAKRDTSVGRSDLDFFLAQFQQLNKYHGSIYRKESEDEIDKAVAKYDDYKAYDWMKGFRFSASRLEKDMFAIDLSDTKELKIPVYFFAGRHDWNVPTAIIEEFVKNLKAPGKEIVWFEDSGHEPLEEEASRFNEEVIRIVK
jgi:proline iminopeptidase